MSKLIKIKPLGEILKEAGLVTASQIEVALHDQAYYQDMRIGEILALRGWIKPNTADFFVEEWWNLIDKEKKHPLGFYFKKAGLLTEKQIQLILQEQNNKLLRFGAIAVSQGLIKQATLDFFLKNLDSNRIAVPNAASKPIEQAPQNQTIQITKEDISYWAILSTRSILSTNGSISV